MIKSLFIGLLLLALGATALPQTTDSQARITNGPVVEGTTATTASIAWTTSVNAGTVIKYGYDQNDLRFATEMPWGGITHRVHLKGLKPATRYFFQAISPQAQGSGATLESPVGSFMTQAVLDGGQPH